MALNLLQDSPLNFNDLNFEFVQEESGGYFAPIDIGNGTTVTKTNSGQYEISGPQGGAIYDANGALLNSYVRTGARTGTMFDPQGNVVGSIDSSSRINEVLSDVFTPIAPAIPAILGTLALGPAGSGLLSAPAAAATAAGGNALFQGGDLEDALRAAALAGVTTFGIEQLFPTAIQAAASTAVDLAGAGASQADIVTALVDQGVRAGTAAQMAGDALAGATARQIATDFAGASIGGTAAGATSLAPNVVEVLGSTAAPGLLATAAPSLAGAASGLLGTQVPAQQAPAVVAQTVPVTSSAAPVELQSIAPAAVGGALTQTVPVQATTAPTGTQVAAPVAAATGGLLAPTQTTTIQSTPQQLTPDEASSIVSALSGQPVSVAGQQVQVAGQTSQQISPDNAAALISAATGQQVTVAGQTTGQQSNTSGAEVAGLLATPSTPPASERVTVEDRPIRREEAQILTPVVTGAVAGVPVADVAVPRSSTGPIEGSTSINPLATAGLLALGASALTGGGSTGTPFDQAAYDAIARGRSPVYPRGDFTPISLGGLPGMGGMPLVGSYDYFGPYYGAGRFGARPQAFALPGLLGPNTGLMATPSRSTAV